MKKSAPIVLFNASVILAGIKSPTGGSGKLLSWAKSDKVKAFISEAIFDEVLRNATKIGVELKVVSNTILESKIEIVNAPAKSSNDNFKDIIIDLGDAHVLGSALEIKAQFLVTLDKKHLLILQKEVRQFKIVSPGQLIEKLS